jgi:hypothetical protein
MHVFLDPEAMEGHQDSKDSGQSCFVGASRPVTQGPIAALPHVLLPLLTSEVLCANVSEYTMISS